MRFCLILYNILRNASIVGQHTVDMGVDAKGRGGVGSGKSERKEAERHG